MKRWEWCEASERAILRDEQGRVLYAIGRRVLRNEQARFAKVIEALKQLGVEIR